MTDETAELLASAIKSLGSSESAKDAVLYAYRIGFIDGQRAMTHRAEQLFKESFLQDNGHAH